MGVDAKASAVLITMVVGFFAGRPSWLHRPRTRGKPVNIPDENLLFRRISRGCNSIALRSIKTRAYSPRISAGNLSRVLINSHATWRMLQLQAPT
jgi:hypothetical protein